MKKEIKFLGDMRARVLTLLLLFLRAWSSTAWADEMTTNEAKVGNTEYATLQAAIDATTGSSKITLLKNVTLTSTLTISQNMTIDMNNFNITASGLRAINTTAEMLWLTGSGTISSNASGTITGPDSQGGCTDSKGFKSSSSVIRVGSNESSSNAGIDVGKDVTISSDFCYGITYFGKGTYTIRIAGKVNVTGYNSCISGNGTDGLNNANVDIYDDAVLTYTPASNATCISPAIYKPEKGLLMIHKATITGPTAIGIKCGEMKINGATITGNGTFSTTSPYSNGIESDGSAILIENNDAYDTGNTALTDITIWDGTIKSTNGYAINETIKSGSSEAVQSVAISGGTLTGATGKSALSFLEGNTKVVVTGGTFSSDVTTYCKQGYTCAKSDDGTYSITNNNLQKTETAEGYVALQMRMPKMPLKHHSTAQT